MKNFSKYLFVMLFVSLQSQAQSFISPSSVTADYYWTSSIKDTFSTAGSVWNSSDSLKIFYNTDSTINARIYYINDADSGWIVSLTDGYSYDTQQRDTQHVYSQWDQYNMSWLNVSKESKKYDANSNLLSTTISNWDTAGYWTNSNLIMNEFNSSNELVKTTYVNWNSASQIWDSAQQFIFTYNGTNQKTIETDYSWDGTMWEKTNKYSYAYNTMGKDTLMTAQYWNGNAWKNSYRDSIEYDSNNNRIKLTRLDWDIPSQSFTLTSAKSEYTFNASNQLTQRTDYNGDGTTAFFPTLSYDYTYDLNGNNNYLILKLYDQNQSQFINYDRYYYEYTYVISAVENTPEIKSTVFLFPNPANDVLKIQSIQARNSEGKMISFDVNGKIVSSKTIKLNAGKNNFELDINEFSSGIYFIQIINTDNHSKSLSRFIKN